MPEMILPGVYIEVRPEGLIIPGQVTVSNIGIVGTASKGVVSTTDAKNPILLGSFSEAKQKLGMYDPWIDGSSNELTLVRALELAFSFGATTVFAVRVAGASAAIASTKFAAEGGGDSITLEANSPGEWGNDIWFSITDGQSTDQPAIVEGHTIPFAAGTKLAPGSIVKSARNRIQIGNRVPKIVYGTPPTPKSGEVGINTDTGDLIFFANEDPDVGSPFKATYAVDASKARIVTIKLGLLQEVYTVVDGNGLFDSIKNSSAWINPKKPTDTTHLVNLPAKGIGFLTGGANGEDAAVSDYEAGLDALLDQQAHIIIAAGQIADGQNAAGQDISFGNALHRHCQNASTDTIKHDRIAIVGSPPFKSLDPILGHTLDSDRVVFVVPGIKTTDAAASPPASITLPGAYTAAAVAGLMASFPPHVSLTNKVLPVDGLETNFTAVELTQLLLARVMPLESHLGFHIVRGITTSTNTAWQQITTRRIVDYAKFGVRSAADPYIGLLNNERVRAALRTTINSFLAEMVNDEMLIGYKLDVTATRQQEISGIVAVTMTLQPVFSIDFIQVTMFLG